MAKAKFIPGQLGLFMPSSNWRPPTSLQDVFDKLKASDVISLDTETKDPGLLTRGAGWARREGNLVGISFACGGGDWYLPFGHEGGDNMDKERVIGMTKDLLFNFKGKLVLMNGMYDLGWLSTEGVHAPQCEMHDIMFAEALLDEHRFSYGLDNVAKSYNLEGKDETLLREAANALGYDPKSELWRMPARFVGPYASADAVRPLEIFKRQLPLIAEQKLEKVMKLEHDLIPILLAMKQRGVRVDLPKAEAARKDLLMREAECLTQIRSDVGYVPEIWSPDSIAVLCDKIGVHYNETAKGSPSFKEEWFSVQTHPAIKLLAQARKYNKAVHTFIEGYILDAHDGGRVRGEFHPLKSDAGGTVAGRFASSDPNLQNIPARDPELGPLIRSMFLPEDGELWCAADYSQQEPRLTVHYAVKFGCTRAMDAAKQYRDNPDTDYHQLVADMANIGRKPAKTINLGLAYGMGGPKLCRRLGLPTKFIETRNGYRVEVAGDEGQAILDKYFGAVPFVPELQELFTNQAQEQGFITTLSGRRCRFNLFEPKWGRGEPLPYEEAVAKYGNKLRRSKTHKALNRKIQGGSADMIKVSIRNMWREGIYPLVTVHDENGASVPDERTAKKVSDIMRDCVKLEVPLKVDVDLGRSWGEARPVQLAETYDEMEAA